MAPTHRSLCHSPRGRFVECFGIWKTQTRESGACYFTMTILHFGFNVKLGEAARQDDPALQTVNP